MQDFIDDSRQDDLYISSYQAAALLGTTDRWVREQIKRGVYRAEPYAGQLGGGADGISYMVDVRSLPTQVQITHALRGDRRSMDVDMAAYRERYGQAGIDELLGKLHAVQETLYVINHHRYERSLTAMKAEIAARIGVDMRTIYRWCESYQQHGVAGLMNKMDCHGKGETRSMCGFTKDYVTSLLTASCKHPSRDIYRRLRDYATALGADGCQRCPYCDGTDVRAQVIRDGMEAEYPLCTEAGAGLITPASRHGIDRFKATLPKGTLAYGRKGPKYWQANFMPKAQREKPEMANEVWFGDHHQFDLFVLDSEGRPVRPWLTAFSDAASGCFPAWRLSLSPNSKTITDAFIEGVSYKTSSPFYGVPGTIYIDNGKDYRSHRFEGGTSVEEDLGQLNKDVADYGLLKILHVKTTHALPYRAWSKTIERLFGTIENKYIRGLPGWCGNSPENRPEDFHRVLVQALRRGELLTFEQFAEIWRDRILPTYHTTRPEEGSQSPLEIFTGIQRLSEDVPDWSILSLARSERAKRVISTQGIKLDSVLYWHDALAGRAGDEAIVLYDAEDRSSITVMVDGRHLCEATVKERLKLVEEDQDIVAAHMAMQQRAQKAAKKPITKAKATMEYAQLNQSGDRVEKRRGSKTVPLELRKAATAREETKRRIAAERDDSQANPIRDKFRAAGAALNASQNA